MRKLFSLLLVVAAMFAITACGGDSSPKSVADKAMSALQKKNYDEFVKYVNIKTKEGEDPETARKMLSGMLQEKADKNYEKKGGFKSYEIVSETIDESGDKALVVVKMTFGNGETEEEDCPMVKDSEGNWKMDMGK